MRLLCLCSGGNIRSVHTALVLKHMRSGHEAIAAGVHTAKPATLCMLCDWADKVLICGDNLIGAVPAAARCKCVQLGIGEDVWGVASMQQDLLALADAELRKVGL